MSTVSGWAKGLFENLGQILAATSRPMWLALAVLVLVSSAAAQTAHLTGGSTITLGSGFNQPTGVAVDKDGNVFVADSGNNAVKELLAAGGYTTVKTLASGFIQLQSVALDADGDLYVAGMVNGVDFGGAVYVVTASSGYTTLIPVTQINWATILIYPLGLAIDKNGNIFVNTLNSSWPGQVFWVEWLAQPGSVYPVASDGAFPTQYGGLPGMAVDGSGNFFSDNQSDVLEFPKSDYNSPFSIATLNGPSGLAIDTHGNLFVAEYLNNAVREIVAVNGVFPNPPTIKTLGSGFNLPEGVAVDESGNVFVADTGNNAVKEILVGSAGANIGTVSVGTVTPPTLTYEFMFTSGGTIEAPAVLTQGAAGQDFTDAGTGTCTTNGTSYVYNVDETCTVDVTFTPKHPGTRYGAIQLLNSSGAAIVTVPVYGTGSGPQIAFAPGVQSMVGSGFNGPQGVAVDGSGNVFVGDTGNNAVKEISATAIRTLGSGFNAPQGLAVDGAANVFVADTGNNAVKEIVAANGVIPASPTINTLGGGFNAPTGVAVDQNGNVIVNDGDGAVKEILASSGYTTVNTLGGSFTYPVLQATDASGNVFEADTANDRVLRTDYADTPQLIFAPTEVGSTSGDSPQTVTVSNIGNADLTFFIPSAGSNASISSGFTLGNTDTCPELSSSSSLAGTVAAGTSCTYLVNFSPATAGPFNGSLALADSNLNATLTQTIALYGTTVNSQSIGFTPPASPVTYGSSSITLVASATSGLTVTFSVLSGPGSITGNVLTVTGVGTIVVAANQAGSASYGPAAEVQQSVAVNQATPAITWATPAAITYGTPLSAAQLDAALSVTGSCAYSPVAGTVLSAGPQPLAATCTPTDGTDYATPSKATVTLTVNPAPLTVIASSASVIYGNAVPTIAPSYSGLVNGDSSNVLTTAPSCTTTYTATSAPGSYPTSCSGAVAANYNIGYVAGSVTVSQAAPAITWATPAAIAYGAGLSSAQLNATASYNNSTVAGIWSYQPAAGAILPSGAQTLTVSFTPSSSNYTTASGSVSLQVNQATPTIAWAAPAAITYGTALSAAQLDAVLSVAGSCTYSPAAGAVLSAGPHTLTATCTPTDTADYATPTKATVTLTVNPAPLTATASSTALIYGNAVPSITPSYSGLVNGDTSSILSATPTCTTTYTATSAPGSYPTSCSGAVAANYSIGYVAGSVTVSQAAPAITWATPAAIAYGAGLSSAQLNATASYNNSTVAGTWSYQPAAGAILPSGAQTLTVSFTPSSSSFATAGGSVSLQVNQATPTIAWAAPAAITYGTALSAAQLDAVLSVAGGCAYSPGAGTVLGAGQRTLSATCTPTDTADYATPSKATVTLTVNPAPLTVMASSSALIYGAAVPAITPGYSGLVNGDTSNVLTTAPSCTTTYTTTSAAGVYPTSCSGAVAANYNIGYVVGSVTVSQAAPAITWATPAAIAYGAGLSSAQLNATASYNNSTVAGTWSYQPAAGAILPSGTQTLTVSFTPSSSNFATAGGSVSLQVNQATPTIAWAAPAAITYGTALSATQLDAVLSVAGSCAYSPAAGAVLSAGPHTLTATCTPTDTADYATPSKATVTLTVNSAPLTVIASSASVIYGNAVPSITPSYSGLVNGDSSNVLTTAPSCTTTYTTTSAAGVYPTTCSGAVAANYNIGYVAGSVTVSQAAPAITWATPAAIAYGAGLSSAQLNATASYNNSTVAGIWSYQPAAGAILPSGAQTLTVSFTPSSSNYTTASGSVSLQVNQATPAITWATPAAITYGTALSAAQLDAMLSVAGSCAYSPGAGTVLGAGQHTLSATCTPTDTADYTTAAAWVTLTVNAASIPAPTLSGLSPAYSTEGGSAFTLTLTGANFTSGATAYWGSTALTTTYVSTTELTAAVPASLVASTGIDSVAVMSSPASASNTMEFAVTSSNSSGAPTISTTSVSVSAGSTASYTVTVPSSASGLSVICLNLPAGASCSYSSGAVTIATSSATPSGTYTVTMVFQETVTSTAWIALPLLLLPLHRARKRLRRSGAKTASWVALVLLAGVMALSGCGGSRSNSTTTTTETTTMYSGSVSLIVK